MARTVCMIGIALALVGCGTVENMNRTGEARLPFGGVAADIQACKAPWSEEPLSPAHGWFPGYVLAHYTIAAGTSCCRLIDLPFSAVGDFFTYPHTRGEDFWPLTPTPEWPDPNGNAPQAREKRP